MNVASVRPDQGQAIEAFLNAGGGVLVTLGSRAEARGYNEEHFRDGRGWLPARLVDPVGDENDLDKAARVVHVEPGKPGAGVVQERRPRQPRPAARTSRGTGSSTTRSEFGGVPIAMLNDRNPLFVEKSVRQGPRDPVGGPARQRLADEPDRPG